MKNTTNNFKRDGQSVGQHHALLPTDYETLLEMWIICVLHTVGEAEKRWFQLR